MRRNVHCHVIRVSPFREIWRHRERWAKMDSQYKKNKQRYIERDGQIVQKTRRVIERDRDERRRI